MPNTYTHIDVTEASPAALCRFRRKSKRDKRLLCNKVHLKQCVTEVVHGIRDAGYDLATLALYMIGCRFIDRRTGSLSLNSVQGVDI